MAKSDQYRRTVSQAEGERLWRIYGFSTPDELVLEDLALARGVIVAPGPLQNMEARLIRRGSQGLIRVRDDIPEPGRKRFAIAHELGHWELHKDASQLLACTDDDMVASYKSSHEEGEANNFAAGLLMPSMLFEAVFDEGPLSFDTLTQAADYFHTSLTATAIRYVELSGDYCAVAVAERGRLRWWRASETFERRFWLECGANLSRDSVAAGLLTGRNHAGPEEVDIQVWSQRGWSSDSQVFLEESLYTKTYDQIITLLRLP